MEPKDLKTPVVLPPLYGLSVPDFEKIYPNSDWEIDANEEFEKTTSRTNLNILGANGKISLTIPVKRFEKGTPTSAIKIDYVQKWQNQHLRSLQSSYGKSPFFEYYRGELETLFCQKPELLTDFTIPILKWIHSQYFPKGKLSVILAQTEKKLVPEDKLHFPFGKDKTHEKQIWKYTQVFGQEFVTGLSVLDMLFCEGPNFANRKTV